MISPTTKLTGILGNPVTHSLSPILHNKIYEEEGIDAAMLAFGNPDVEKLVAAMRALPIHLAAVTMPHKQTILPLLDAIDDEAKAIGAVNTVVNREGKLTGYNTDIVGISTSLSGIPLQGANVLLIGAGGAAHTVAYLLKKEGATLHVANRDRAQADELIAHFGGKFIESGAFGETKFTLVINATPVGMKPNTDSSAFPEELITKDMAIFDLVYSPLETKLLKSAERKGAKAISGLTMFLEQGVEQERLWLGKKLDSSKYGVFLASYVRDHD